MGFFFFCFFLPFFAFFLFLFFFSFFLIYFSCFFRDLFFPNFFGIYLYLFLILNLEFPFRAFRVTFGWVFKGPLILFIFLDREKIKKSEKRDLQMAIIARRYFNGP